MTIRHPSASHGGQIYVPLVNWLLCFSVIAVALVTILLIWQWGNSRLKSSEDERQIPLDHLPVVLCEPLLVKVPGTAIHVTLGDGVPISMVQRITLFRVIDVDPVIVQVHSL